MKNLLHTNGTLSTLATMPEVGSPPCGRGFFCVNLAFSCDQNGIAKNKAYE